MVYDVRWYDRRGKRHSEMVGYSLAEARRAAEHRTAELNTVGDIVPVRHEDFAKEHNASLTGKSANYIKDHERTLKRFKEFAPEYVCDVTVADVEAFRAKLQKDGLRPATINGELRILKAALNHAVKLGYLQRNPCCAVKMLSAPIPPRRVLTAEECQKLLDACPDEYWRAFIYTALTTGMRLGELLAVEWEDIDLLTGMVEVNCKAGHATKSRRNRMTSTTRQGCEMLTRIRVAHPEAAKVFADTGGNLTELKIVKGFSGIMTAAGIAKCTLHDLRRTNLTMLATKLPAFALQQRAGHVSPATTAAYYIGDLAKESAKIADGVFGGILKVDGQ